VGASQALPRSRDEPQEFDFTCHGELTVRFPQEGLDLDLVETVIMHNDIWRQGTGERVPMGPGIG
jgi:hypothetical protein